MKRYIKDGTVRTARQISVLKTIETEREVMDYEPIEGEEVDGLTGRVPKMEAIIKTEKITSTVMVYNPSEEDILADGWKVYTPEPQPELGIKDLYTRDEYIRALIAEQYRLEDEIALINNYLSDASKYKEEYEEYQRFRAAAKSKASEIFG